MNNRNMENEKDSGVSRLVGGTREDEKEFFEYFKTIFESHKHTEKLEEEREKTSEEIELIKQINKLMKKYVEDCDGYFIEVCPENIHICDIEKLGEQIKKETLEGTLFYTGGSNPDWQGILVADEHSKLILSKTIVHELLHFNAFVSYSFFGKNLKKMERRREGLLIFTRGGMAFQALGEAIIEQLAIRFDEKFFSRLDYLSDELKLRDKLRKKHIQRGETGEAKDLFGVATKKLPDGRYESTEKFDNAYKQERQDLWRLINDIYDKNKEKFASAEDVFQIFVRAVFDGNLFPVAKLVERTFGKGSFRRIGKEDAKKSILEKI